MKLSEMRQTLAQSGIRLTKSLGQNFLHDANQLRRIVAAADLSGADKVLEIGPELGPLTELLLADALELLSGEPRDWTNWKVVSNLPYSVASPIVVELAQAERGPERIVVTLQREVARRLMARPGGADYGLLTLLVQLNYEPRQFFKIPASC